MSDGFLDRWARKKTLQTEISQRARDASKVGPHQSLSADNGQTLEASQNAVQSADNSGLTTGEGTASPSDQASSLTMADVEAVPVGGDVSRFMGLDVPDNIRSAALKRLFSAPEYNVRSQMDVYWEDYSNLPKLSQDEIRSLTQSESLFLFKDPPWKDEQVDGGDRESTDPAQVTASQLDSSESVMPAVPCDPQPEDVAVGSGHQDPANHMGSPVQTRPTEDPHHGESCCPEGVPTKGSS